ncbi:DUF1878 family protein [Calidifontibacillus erzurumensis]|uniref:DUF1878 family protein n=1 Tax=Calidifontibacillus erzurumensis TaxID=2741433 RepID=A0A8J8KBJ3_9BACI|nr:DUF1878 family protein [Calidifontibacillus erzurumensis]NSL51999.1 DUF1878 family protein [Calidifontibacillus erzurumensis]
MEEIEKRLKKIEYYQRLLLEMMRGHRFPLHELIMRKDLTEEDVEEFFSLCEELNHKWKQQKEEGFVYFSPLLNEFMEKLNPKLEPIETIDACLGQNVFRPLMEVLKNTLDSIVK